MTTSLLDADVAINPTAVSRLVIEGLHGLYDYDRPLIASDGVARLSLLYGDNGSGKTTILRLLWDVLSPSGSNQHRERIAETAFSRFVVYLGPKTSISLSRPLPVVGPYSIVVKKNGKIVSKSSWPEKRRYEDFFDDWATKDFAKNLRQVANEDPEIIAAGESARGKKLYLEFLDSLGSAPYFLADDRSTASDDFLRDSIDRDARIRNSRLRNVSGDDSSKDTSRLLARELSTSIRRVNIMLQQLALGGTASGSTSANNVYLDVIKQVGASASDAHSDGKSQKEKITKVLGDLGERSKSFERLGLTPRFVSGDFAKAVRNVDDSKADIAVGILEPYIESMVARLDALESAQSLISTFLDQANSFLTGKYLSYNARGGVSIKLHSEERLNPDQLSSGECHLILLLCNALLARDGSKLFLIDEPELSLNVKWQRRIISALLACTAGSQVQFLIATHSIELLAPYRTNVVRMVGDETLDRTER